MGFDGDIVLQKSTYVFGITGEREMCMGYHGIDLWDVLTILPLATFIKKSCQKPWFRRDDTTYLGANRIEYMKLVLEDVKNM